MKALIIGGILLALLTAGCATISPEQRAFLEAQASRCVYCEGKDDCEVKWSRTMQWVKQNGAYRFDQVTDNIISTKGPLPYDCRPAFIITKVAQGNGRFVFDFDGGCDNMFGCIPSMLEAKANFVMFVMGPGR